MIIGFIIIGIIIFAIVFLWKSSTTPSKPKIPPEKVAGNYGEKIATSIIKRALNSEDVHITNVSIEFEGKIAECDNIIINHYGVFIIEVKNFVGKLYGNENESEWLKIKTTHCGNDYNKYVRNPIPQIKRQTYILSWLLRSHGIKVWVESYVYFVNNNSPIKHAQILEAPSDIQRAIHTASKYPLSDADVQSIVNICTSSQSQE